jgi:DNA-cytosine methyltransferase
MNVLSLFDGISAGQVALERAGIKVNKYYASEIDKYAIQVTQKNYPNTIQLGDVTKIDFNEYMGKIDLLIGGSPCQGFSFVGKQLNFEDPRSKLFFKFVEALNSIKPKYFLLENVKMKKEYQDIISEHLGVEPIEINSALVSAQQRKRLYWTNMPNIKQPENQHIYLKDILEKVVDKKYCLIGKHLQWFIENSEYQLRKKYCSLNTMNSKEKAITMTARQYANWNGNHVVYESTKRVGVIGNGGQGQRVYDINGKSVALSALGGGQGAKTGLYLIEVIQEDIINGELLIRKLTPIECERLQNLPDDYSCGISDSQRYKCLGNGWTVDVIVHMLKNIIKVENIKIA